jgi:hypothetical protein
MDALVLNGLVAGRLENALKEKPVTGTKIIGKGRVDYSHQFQAL